MNIEDLTIGQIKEIKAMFPDITAVTTQHSAAGDHPFTLGKNYLIRTVTHIQTGKLIAVTHQELVLTQAAWIADTGRFANSLANSDFAEVEPFPADKRVIVGRGALIDAVEIIDLPTKQK